MKGEAIMPTRQQYQDIFDIERLNKYPAVTMFELEMGFAIPKDYLESVAFTLNCPFKVNPPNWQHGRVIYATLRNYLARTENDVGNNAVLLDIGTAKGFSAVMMAKALLDEKRKLPIDTVDMIGPAEVTRRNTVYEVEHGYSTLFKIMEDFIPSDSTIRAYGSGSLPLLATLLKQKKYVPFAFVDGKHSYTMVMSEGQALSELQRSGDVTIFDDCQIPEVRRAVNGLRTYEKRELNIGPRTYIIARKK